MAKACSALRGSLERLRKEAKAFDTQHGPTIDEILHSSSDDSYHDAPPDHAGILFTRVANSSEFELIERLSAPQIVDKDSTVLLVCDCGRREGFDAFTTVEGAGLLKRKGTIRTDQLGAKHSVNAKMILDILNP